MIYDLDDKIRVKMFGHVSQKHGKWHNGSISHNCTILYCTFGEINMQISDEIFHVETDDLLLIPRNTHFRPLDGGSCKYYFFNFESTVLEDTLDLPKPIIISPHPGLSDGYAYSCVSKYPSIIRVQKLLYKNSFTIRNIFERAEKLHPNEKFSDQLLLDHLLKEILLYIGNDNSHLSNQLIKILKYIDRHYSASLSLSVLSEKLGLSQSYIALLFKKELACKPSEYINNVRVTVAKTILSETDMPVSEISEKVGYSDVYYFSKIFKKIIGVPPSKIRSHKN